MIDAVAHAGGLNNRGLELWGSGDLEGARLHFTAALQVVPDFGPALANLAAQTGKSWTRERKLAAISMLKRLVAANPHDGNQWNNLGTFLMQIERYDEAFEAMERAAKLTPDAPATWHNLALVCLRTHKIAAALEHLDRVNALGVDTPTIDNDRAHAFLALGDLERALAYYEARWSTMMHLEPWDYYIPEWKGEDLRGRRILVHHEQGFGDTIMTLRFYKQLVERGASITFCVHPRLVRLIEAQGWPVEVVSMAEIPDDARERFDFHSPLYSAMRWLDIKNPSEIDPAAYIRPPRVVTPGVPAGVVNVGVCWASGTRGSEMDWRRRVTPLSLWLTIAEVPGVQLHSLYPDGRAEIEALGAEYLISDSTAKFEDWADTAAFVNKLDLVISVDTAIVHLAGALGKPVWLISQFSHCWRWWNIDEGSGRPWYESVSIIAANEPDAWEDQLREAKFLLRNLEEVQDRIAA